MFIAPSPLAIFGLGPTEMIIIGIVMLLIFGRRLPEVARNMGRGVVEFKKGISGIEEDVQAVDSEEAASKKSDSATKD